jgi:hypothetical protein
MILYLKDPKDSCRRLLDLIHTFSSRRIQNQHTKISTCSEEHAEKEIRKIVPPAIASKDKK